MPPEVGKPEGDRVRIVIVDDNADILDTTSELLEHAGYETIRVNSGAKVLSTIQRTRPALVLQDVFMPDLDLGSLLRSLRADPLVGRTPVLLFTASVEGEDIVPQVGADGLLRKPFDLDHLRATIDTYIQRAAAKPR